MAITLTSEQENTLRRDAAALGFDDVEEYLADRLRSMHHQDQYWAENKERFDRMIDEGLAEADRGELLTSEEAKSLSAKFKREVLAARNVQTGA